MPAAIARNLAEVRERIAAACRRAGRDPGSVDLVAVTKGQDPGALHELAAAGQLDFGENRLDHLRIMHAAAPAGARFHFLGRVQGRQLAKLVPLCRSLHSLASPDHVERLARACADLPAPFPVFVQVNTAGEPQKAGVMPAELPRMLDRLARHGDRLSALGLMCMAPDRDAPGVDDDAIRRCFAELRELGRRHGLERLSMGMTKDFEIAVEEGATDVRVGTALFVAAGQEVS